MTAEFLTAVLAVPTMFPCPFKLNPVGKLPDATVDPDSPTEMSTVDPISIKMWFESSTGALNGS